MFEIHCIPVYQDNYVWIITSEGSAWIVDPGDHKPVIDFLERNALAVEGILVTHRHWDHVTGVQPLIDYLAPAPIPVYGPDSPTINALVSDVVREGDIIPVGPLEAQVWETPGHTLDHVSYYLKAENTLFCGDTLFACGCGKLFDGTAEQLYRSLQRIAQLPIDTKIYCTHEYTLANIGFALAVEPDNVQLKIRQSHCQQLRAAHQPSLPTTLALELATNPFLRINQPNVRASIEKETGSEHDDAICRFGALRNWKNRY